MLQPSDYAVSNHESPNGFVSVATAERLRQVSALEDFKARHPDVYARAVEATLAVKLARRELEIAKAELVKLCPQGKANDLLTCVEVDTVAALKALANRPRVAPAPPVIMAGQDVDLSKVGITATKLEPVKIGGQELKGPRKSKSGDASV